MSNKLKIKENIVSWDSYEMDGKLPEIIEKLNGVIQSNTNHFDFKIEVESESGWYDSCSTNILITAYRMETDEEFDKRIVASKKASEAAKLAAKVRAENEAIREKQLYESLKRKFEKEIDKTSNL